MQIINTQVELRCQGEPRYCEIDDNKVQSGSVTIPDSTINLLPYRSGEQGAKPSGRGESASLVQAHRSS